MNEIFFSKEEAQKRGLDYYVQNGKLKFFDTARNWDLSPSLIKSVDGNRGILNQEVGSNNYVIRQMPDGSRRAFTGLSDENSVIDALHFLSRAGYITGDNLPNSYEGISSYLDDYLNNFYSDEEGFSTQNMTQRQKMQRLSDARAFTLNATKNYGELQNDFISPDLANIIKESSGYKAVGGNDSSFFYKAPEELEKKTRDIIDSGNTNLPKKSLQYIFKDEHDAQRKIDSSYAQSSFAYGGAVESLLSLLNRDSVDPQQHIAEGMQREYDLLRSQPNRIESPEEALDRVNVRRDIATANSGKDNDWLMALGATMGAVGGALGTAEQNNGWNNFRNTNKTEKFAMGGNVERRDIEAEGNEVIETPDGSIFGIEGPNHSEGGVPMNVPVGSKISSDRISIDGMSMADRKKRRTKNLSKLEKEREKNSMDILIKNALNRMNETSQQEEEFDEGLQEAINQEMEAQQIQEDEEMLMGLSPGMDDPNLEEGIDPVMLESMMMGEEEVPKFASGTKRLGVPPPTLDSPFLETYYKSEIIPGLDIEKIQKENEAYNLAGNIVKAVNPFPQIRGDYDTTSKGVREVSNENLIQKVLGSIRENNALPTAGDALSILGTYMQANRPRNLTLESRAGDSPSRNFMEDYGKEGMETIDSIPRLLKENYDLSMQEALEASRAMQERNRNSARGVNTMRALDLGAESGMRDARRKATQDFNSQLMQVLTGKAQTQNQIDEVVARGEQQRVEDNIRDRDNFFSQLAGNERNMGQVIGRVGEQINALNTRDSNMRMINNMTDYVQIDSKGRMKIKPGISTQGNYRNIISQVTSDKTYLTYGYTEADWNKASEDEQAASIYLGRRATADDFLNGKLPEKKK